MARTIKQQAPVSVREQGKAKKKAVRAGEILPEVMAGLSPDPQLTEQGKQTSPEIMHKVTSSAGKKGDLRSITAERDDPASGLPVSTVINIRNSQPIPRFVLIMDQALGDRRLILSTEPPFIIGRMWFAHNAEDLMTLKKEHPAAAMVPRYTILCDHYANLGDQAGTFQTARVLEEMAHYFLNFVIAERVNRYRRYESE